MTVTGVDVSNHSPSSWRPKSGDAFAFILTSDGHTWKSPTHDAQVNLTRKAGQVVGHYHWMRHGNIAAQAAWFLKCAKIKAGDVLIIDKEQQTDGSPNPTDADLTQFIAELRKRAAGHRIVPYMNVSWWNASDKTKEDGLWLASPDGTPSYGGWLFWQSKFGSVDLDKAKFDNKADMVAWAKGVKAEKKAAASVVTTLAGTPVDVPKVGTATRQAFRDRLTNTAGKYPGCVCPCTPQFIALVEALAKEAKLPVPLQFWEGSFIVTASSGQTHAGGGAFDINISGLTAAQVAALVKICRTAGGAAWHRDMTHGGFPTPHIHVEIIGCSHASSAAKAQWKQYKQGRDGLARNGADYGPKVTYITAAKAYTKLTRTEQDWLTMATQKEVQAAFHAELAKYFGDVIPSPSLSAANVKKNPKWTLPSTLYWLVKLVSLMRKDMPTKAQMNDLIKAVKEGK